MGGDLYDPKKDKGSKLHKKESDSLFDEDEYEQFETIPSMNQPQTAVKPEDLRLMHRIGRGPFGDVWLGTLHSHREDFDEFHEVAVKVLPSIAEDHIRNFASKLEGIFCVSQGVTAVSWPRGLSMKDGKACVITKLYEASIGDKMARLPGNRLPLADALRYGVNLAQGLLDLHSRGILALNLKPSNFLIDDHDQAVLGEFGIPFLLMEAVSPDGPLVWLGTPNYMAPEQWDPKVRGPITSETDSWGFACSMVEMLTGVKPWNHMSAGDIFDAVVVRRQKPAIPTGLPPAVQKILRRCLEYDYHHRPKFSEILGALSSPDVVFKEADWVLVSDRQGTRIGVVKKVKGPESVMVQYCDKPEEPVEYTGLARCSLWKDPFQVGDTVRLKQSVAIPRFAWSQQADAEGTIADIDKENAAFLVKFGESREVFKADPAELDLVSAGICVGDWIHLHEGWSREESGRRPPSCVGIVHKVLSNGVVHAAFLGREITWEGAASNLKKVSALHVGQLVKLKNEVVEPRFEWPVKKSQCWETGRISSILPNGGLIVDFPGRLWNRKCCCADAEEVEIVRLNDCNTLVAKYEHLQAMHWAIGPALCLLGFLAAARVGTVLGTLVIRPLTGKRRMTSRVETSLPADHHQLDYEGPSPETKSGPSNPAWLPPAVASILFKEGATNS